MFSMGVGSEVAAYEPCVGVSGTELVRDVGSEGVMEEDEDVGGDPASVSVADISSGELAWRVEPI